MKTQLLLTSLAAVFALGACANRAAPDSPQQQASGHCRLLQGDTGGAGRKVVYRCNGQAILNSAEAKAVLDPSVTVSFGGGGAVIKNDLITRQAANRVGKTDSATCERALLNAAKKFQETALKHGGRRVSDFHSYYDRKTLKGGQFDCEVGSFHGRVVMKGDVAR